MPLSWNIKRILNIVLALIVVGMALWLINTYVPMAGSIKGILNIVVVAATCVLVLQAVGLWSPVVRAWNTLIFRQSAPVAERDKNQPQPDAAVPQTDVSGVTAEKDAGSPLISGRA